MDAAKQVLLHDGVPLAADFNIYRSPSAAAFVVIDTTTGQAYYSVRNGEFVPFGGSTSGGSSGTVTSVAATVPSFLSVSGSPITSSGTLAITLSGTALPIANGGTGATSASAARTALGMDSLGYVVGPASSVNSRVAVFSGTTGKIIADSGLTLSGTNTGDQTSVTGNAGTATALQTGRTIDGVTFDGTANITVIAPGTHAATSKTTPVDADELPIVDSAASNVLKKLTWANLRATAKTYFDTLYSPVGAAMLASANVFTRAQTVTPVTLTDGANIATDASLSNAFSVTLGGNRTLDNPTNLTNGCIYNWRITQDGTGSRTLAYGSKFKWQSGTAPVLSTVAGSVDLLTGQYWGDTDTILCVALKKFS